jgi:hypothetical protein
LPSDASAPTPDASASVNGDPPILGPGDTSVVKSQDASATVTIVSVKASRVSGSTKVTLEVRYKNDGPGQFAIDPLAWSLITSSGELVELGPAGGSGLQAQTLAAGESRGGTLAGSVHATPDEAFIEYTDDTGAVVFVVPANGS